MKYHATLGYWRTFHVLGALSMLTLAGCLAQQADLKNTSKQLKGQIEAAKKDLNSQIQAAKTELDRVVNQTRARLNEDITQIRERELATVRNELEKRAHEGEKLRQNQDDLLARLDRTSKEIREQSNLLTAAKNDLRTEQDKFRGDIKTEQERLRSDQERFRSDFREAVTKDLSKLSGDSAAQLAKLNLRAGELETRLTGLENFNKKISERIDEQSRGLQSAEHRSTAFLQRLEAQDKALTEVRDALGQFKSTLTGLGEKIVAQDKSTTDLSGSISQQTAALGNRVDELAAEVKSITQHMNEVSRSTNQHLDDVNKSSQNVKKALETAGDRFVGRLDTQEQKIEQLGKQVTWLQEAAKALDTGGSKVTSRMEEQDQRVEQLTKQIAWLQDAAKELELSGDRYVPRMEAQDQRMQDMAKQIEWLRDVVKQLDGQASLASSTRNGSGEVPSDGKAAATKLGKSAAHAATLSAPSTRDTVRARYEQVLARMREGDLDYAQEGFTAFLTDHPSSELTPNAKFWLGESYYGKKDYRRAIDAYERVERDHPNSEKVPAALLKKGYAFLALRDARQATAAFQQLVTRYPKTNEAGKATEKLAQLKRDR
ncbi:hypothetical protein YTPLAS18_27750 [Nitrospira sp.]|nr:hypothetical protein YTPLAS18_27750 [Nitrospira sp.]